MLRSSLALALGLGVTACKEHAPVKPLATAVTSPSIESTETPTPTPSSSKESIESPTPSSTSSKESLSAEAQMMAKIAQRIIALRDSGYDGIAPLSDGKPNNTYGFVYADPSGAEFIASEQDSVQNDPNAVTSIQIARQQKGKNYYQLLFLKQADGQWNAYETTEAKDGTVLEDYEVIGHNSVTITDLDTRQKRISTDSADIAAAFSDLASQAEAILSPVSGVVA